MTRKADVIVVGGGVIGSSTAYQLAKRGLKVLLLEKEDFASGASGACDTGIFLQSKKKCYLTGGRRHEPVFLLKFA